MCPSCREEIMTDKCPKIFRPWDIHQDATISTTTEEKCLEDPKTDAKIGFRPPQLDTISKTDLESPQYHQPPITPATAVSLACFDFPQGASDPLLESLAHGYALEEYARILSQEHQAKILSARKQRPKKYKCPHCNVGFSNNGQLKGHVRIHTGERPFKCEEKDCGKTFTRNEELTRHKRIHSGLRPFPCTHCGKRFGRKDHLKKHSRTHFQPRGVYAVPVMLPFEAWASSAYNGDNPYLHPASMYAGF